jgi:cytochrome c556
MRRRLAGAIVAAGAIIAAAGIAWAQDAATAIKNRQDFMKAQNKDLGAVGAYIRGKGELAAAQAAGADLVTRIPKVPSLFPQKTSLADYPGKTAAKPTVWSEWDKFNAAAQNAETKAKALDAALKSGDKAAITAAYRDLGNNGCDGCHGTFRENKPS